MWHFFQQKIICTLCTILFSFLPQCKNATQKHLNFANEDIYRFFILFYFNSFLFSSKKLKSNSIAMIPNPYVLFNKYMPYKKIFLFHHFFSSKFQHLIWGFFFHINSLELIWHLNPSSTILPHLEYQHSILKGMERVRFSRLIFTQLIFEDLDITKCDIHMWLKVNI